jgi:Fe-S cluster biosynthesis and repair protein YggX
MTRTVMCRKYQREMEGLSQPPFPGARGQMIFDSVSKQAWQEWLAHQTMLVNEKRLNLMDRTTRAFLEEEVLLEPGSRQGRGLRPAQGLDAFGCARLLTAGST